MTHRKCVRKTVSLNLTEKYVLKIEVPSLDWEPPSCLCIVPWTALCPSRKQDEFNWGNNWTSWNGEPMYWSVLNHPLLNFSKTNKAVCEFHPVMYILQPTNNDQFAWAMKLSLTDKGKAINPTNMEAFPVDFSIWNFEFWLLPAETMWVIRRKGFQCGSYLHYSILMLLTQISFTLFSSLSSSSSLHAQDSRATSSKMRGGSA